MLLTAASCNVALDAPPGVTITCAAGGRCPGDLVCVQDVNACVERGTTCVEQRGSTFFPAADGNLCTRDGGTGVCRSGACIRCGDGVVDEGETCDDGNLESSDACPINCLTARCGDGYVQRDVEQCDDGNAMNDDACLTTCVSNICGDGFVDGATEECDDQNSNENDGCSQCRATQWQASIAFGLGRDNAAPATASLSNLGALATTRNGLLYAAWSQTTTAGDLVAFTSTVGGVYMASSAANVVLPATRQGSLPRADNLPESGLARSLQLGLVPGIATDARGEVYVTMIDYLETSGSYIDYGAYVLRLDTSGFLHIIAGGERRCLTTADTESCGGLGRARDASFSDLGGLAFDRRGRLHIVDGTSVRYIDTDGTIHQRAGVASESCATSGCNDGGTAQGARFIGPLAIAVDADDNLYIADYGDHRVRRVGTDDTISTVLGNGTACVDWPACNAGQLLSAPSGLASDGANLFIVDAKADHKAGGVVRRLHLGESATQIVFGTGGSCAGAKCGDDSVATNASSGFIEGITVLDGGGIAITDVDSTTDSLEAGRPARIRVIDLAANRVTALVGSYGAEPPDVGNRPTSHEGGLVAYANDGTIVFATTSRLYAIDQATNHVVLLAGADGCTEAGSDCGPASGPASSFNFGRIGDLATSVDTVYVADRERRQVYGVANGVVTHVFGSSELCPSAQCPNVADAREARVKSIGGITYAAGHLYVTDPTSHTVWDATLGGGAVVFAGTGVAGSTGDTGPATAATFRCPFDVLASADGAVYITDADACNVRAVRSGVITTAASGPSCIAPGDLTVGNACGGWAAPADRTPVSLAEDATGVVVGSTDTVSRLSGSTLTRIVGALPRQSPNELREGRDALSIDHSFVSIAATPGRPLLVRSGLGDTVVVRRLDADGTMHVVLGAIDATVTGGFDVAELATPFAAARLDANRVLLADAGIGAVRLIDTGRREVEPAIFSHYGFDLLTTAARPARFTAAFPFRPDAIAVDTTGHHVYLAQSGSGDFATVDAPDFNDVDSWSIIANARLRDTHSGILGPRSLASDGVSGRVYVADNQQHGVYLLDAATLAGAPIAGTPPFVGFAGDGGPATAALLDTPQGLIVAPSGAVFVSDYGNNRVRRISPDGRIDTILGTGVASSAGSGGPARDLPVDGPTALAFDQYGNLLVSAGPVLRVVYADASGEPSLDSLGGTLYDARNVPTQRDVIRCLTAAFSGNDGEIYVADACAGAVLLLQRL